MTARCRRIVRWIGDASFIFGIGLVYASALTVVFGVGLRFVGYPTTVTNVLLLYPVSIAITFFIIRAGYEKLIAGLRRSSESEKV